MSSRIKVFWLEETDLVRVSLRRFTFQGDKKCRASEWGHDTSVVIVEDALRDVWLEETDRGHRTRTELVTRDDPRWPQECGACGAPFQLDDEWQVNAPLLHRGAPNGRLYTLRDAPAGAMWDAHWMGEWHRGPDGLCLMVRTPGGDWMVDGEASNCTRPQQETREDGNTYLTPRTHACWPRSGDPRTGMVDVRKEHGETCGAGAGSIQVGRYHAFLHNGHLVQC